MHQVQEMGSCEHGPNLSSLQPRPHCRAPSTWVLCGRKEMNLDNEFYRIPCSSRYTFKQNSNAIHREIFVSMCNFHTFCHHCQWANFKLSKFFFNVFKQKIQSSSVQINDGWSCERLDRHINLINRASSMTELRPLQVLWRKSKNKFEI